MLRFLQSNYGKFHFTFQYGSTLIIFLVILSIQLSFFTFQYGSTLIDLLEGYITTVGNFTFQYGSTLIRLISIFDFLIYSDIYFVYLKNI